jgi:flagellar basal-body rod modification protein FlgD
MSTQPIGDPTTTSTTSSTTTPTNPSGQLDDNEFLQLMVTQLQDQDPLDPTDTSDYLSQLAQFTSLEQETNTATNTQQLEASNQTTQALSLLNQNVTYINTQGSTETGVVTSIDLTGSSPTLTIGGTSGIATSQVQSVS